MVITATIVLQKIKRARAGLFNPVAKNKERGKFYTPHLVDG